MHILRYDYTIRLPQITATMALTNDQLQQLLRAARGSVLRLREFSSGDPNDWLHWRRHFELVAAENEWNHQRARRALATAMTGLAQEKVGDIPVGAAAVQGHDVQDVRHLLDRYENRFVLPEASREARAALKASRQRENEDIVSWHSRVRTLFLRAYPGTAAAALNTSGDLIDTFTNGLADPVIKEFTIHDGSDTFNRALASANRHSAARKQIGKGNTTMEQHMKHDHNINYMNTSFRGRGGGNNNRGGRGGSRGGGNWQNGRGNNNNNNYNNNNNNGPANRNNNNNRGGYNTNNSNRGSNSMNSSSRSCNFCKKAGHFWRQCRGLRRAMANTMNNQRGSSNSGGNRYIGNIDDTQNNPPMDGNNYNDDSAPNYDDQQQENCSGRG